MRRLLVGAAMTRLLVTVFAFGGLIVGVLVAQHDERERYGSCTASQVTSKDTRTAVQIRKDMDR